MAEVRSDIERDVLDRQHPHWEGVLFSNPDMFGLEPSEAARKAVDAFKREGARKLLELGGGQGRDTLFFAREGFEVTVLDYAQSGLDAVKKKADAVGLPDSVIAIRHDVRGPLPFGDGIFDGCFSHMLFCMALPTAQLERLSAEVRRVLKPKGLNIYTVRHTGDSHFKTGIHRGEDMYEVGGFIVHFFSREKVGHLAKGYEILAIDPFEEGGLPRKLFCVTLRKV
jgi:SAM-dependent methyltransferase